MLFIVRGVADGKVREVTVEAASIADARRKAVADGHFETDDQVVGVWERRDRPRPRPPSR
jgi:hypothetical protein